MVLHYLPTLVGIGIFIVVLFTLLFVLIETLRKLSALRREMRELEEQANAYSKTMDKYGVRIHKLLAELLRHNITEAKPDVKG